MSYFLAKTQEIMRERAYKIYVTESLFAQGAGKRLTKSYRDLIKSLERTETDNRSGDEIAADVIHKIGLRTE